MRAASSKPACRLANTPDDCQRLGLDAGSVAAREDGLRTDTASGSYEWWYFDAHLDGGSSLVIVFYTKNPLAPEHPLEPFVTVQLDRPGAETMSFEQHALAGQFSARKDGCEGRIADSTFRGDLRSYRVHVAHDGVRIDAELTAQVRSWRPATGCLYFGEHDEHFVAWLPAVPQGAVSVELSDGSSRTSGIPDELRSSQIPPPIRRGA